MAIQTINLTVPGGDTPRSANTKINANFSDQTNAASRMVGKGTADISDNRVVAEVAFTGRFGRNLNTLGLESLADVPSGGTHYIDTTSLNDMPISNIRTCIVSFKGHSGAMLQIFHGFGGNYDNRFFLRSKSGVESWCELYHTRNTTKEEGTGYLVVSSPVLKVQHDSFERIHEAERLDIDIKHIKTGVYEITGTTGLREGDGWKLKPPKDVNGNVLCVCEATESEGVITLKTYKKKFDFETVSIVADYEQPTDIPEGAVVMLRFNDLPQEQLDEPIE